MALVLIVDDNVDACWPLSLLFKRLGHEADYVTSGEQALAYLREKRMPSLLILDVMMPGMDGLEVLQTVRSEPRLAGLPIVMFTASADGEHRRLAMELGANDFWTKGTLGFEMIKARSDKYLAASSH